ncbi:MAG: hypothetical protein JW838_04990 [Spirochaetes bacterium]|nr:hypothetical protein [Spirochaetota bacterium]
METTLYIRQDLLKKINAAASANGVSRSKIILSLMARVVEDTRDPVMHGTLVSYQGRSNAEDWHRFHLKVRADEYEYLLDLRKLLKMSVSKILAYAVVKYIRSITIKYQTDNYPLINYIITREIMDNIIYYRLIWGYPPQIEKFGIV